jgi:ubiquitin-protein ligase E3 C
MFAEELGGNATRRRQEEAKAKRRQLKQQQQKKAQQQQQQQKNASSASAATPPTTGAATATATANAPVQKEANVASIPSTMPPVIATVPAENGKSSAVAIALQQRQQRHAAQNQQKSSIKIQSFYRTHRSNCNLLRHQSTLLDQRLTDLSTLRDLLKQNANTTDYVPPPATSTALCLQLLFLTKMIPYNRREGTARFVKLRDPLKDPKKVQKIMDLVILPGIYSPDENVNPFVVWLQSREGKLRLESLLRVCLVTATSPNVDDQVLKKCMKFVLAVTVPRTNEPKVHPSILNACRSMLLSELPPGTDAKATNTKKKQPQRHARLGSSLDLISILRFHLLYSTGGPQPIPPTSDKLRESCIPAKHRTQADALFQAVLEAVQETSNLSERRNLFLRFVSEILTVPLLTWKTSDTSTSKLLVRDTQNNNNKLLLVSLIENFTDHYGDILTAGDIELILCNDTSLTSCPATPTQCLLANTIQIGRSCIKLNGSDVSKLDYESSATFFRFIATLVDAVPLGTFSSRESVVEWISDGQGHHSPVVLSPVVMEQCKVLLVDAFCRKLFHCAIDQTSLKTDEILALKNDKDLKHEKDLQEAGASAATLAAKEARVDRSKKFWNSSAWARKLTKGVSKMFDSNTNDSASTTSGGKLIDASSVSRKLAQGGSVRNTMETESSTTSGGDAPRLAYTPDLLIALCHVYGIVLARWGGGGGEDIVKGVAATRRDSKGFNQEVATTKADLCTQSLLNVLCFSTSVIRASWGVIQSDSAVVANLYSIIDPSKGNVPVRSLSIRPSYGSSKKRVGNNDGGALLFVFVTTLSHVLIVTDDTEIHDMERPLPLHQLRRCIQTLKQLLYRACCVDDASSSTEGGSFNKSSIRESNYFGLALTYAASRTMRDLYDRSSRRPFCVPKLWLIEDLMEREIRRCKVEGDYVSLLSAPVLRVCPFLVSFKRRLRIFERIVSAGCALYILY